MDNILELLKSIPMVGWVVGGVIALIGVKLVINKKGIGDSSSGISVDSILGNLRNNRGRTERAADNNRDATESVDNAGDRIDESKRIVDNAEDTVDSARERLDESQRVNESAQSSVNSFSDKLGTNKELLSRASDIIKRVRSRKSGN